MDQLVAQDVKPVKDEAQNANAVARLECLREAEGRCPELLLLVLEAVDPVVVLPERIEDVAIFHEHSHRA